MYLIIWVLATEIDVASVMWCGALAICRSNRHEVNNTSRLRGEFCLPSLVFTIGSLKKLRSTSYEVLHATFPTRRRGFASPIISTWWRVLREFLEPGKVGIPASKWFAGVASADGVSTVTAG